MSTPRLTLDVPGHDGLAVDGGDIAEVSEEQAIALAFPVPGTRVAVDGDDLSKTAPAGRVRAGLVVLGHVEVSPDDSLVDHVATVAGVGGKQAAALVASAPLLAGRPEALAGWLSGGERQVLGWLRTLALRPRVVVLDGAGRGMDLPTLAWAGEQVAAWRAEGVAVLVRVGREEEQAWLDSAGVPADSAGA